MSWGERSCIHYGGCNYEPQISTCDVDCSHYESNGRPADSIAGKQTRKIKTLPCVTACKKCGSENIKPVGNIYTQHCRDCDNWQASFITDNNQKKKDET